MCYYGLTIQMYLYNELPVPYKLSQELEAKLKQFYDSYHYLDMYFPYWVS